MYRRNDRRKTRADNFSEEDKNLLLSLIAEHIPILESRRTDHRNNSAKYRAWAAISKNFHRQASHPRNFTQMKDLYRRLKLKAKKEVGMWLKFCSESGTGALPPGCELTPPDDTSFLIFEMIRPHKEDLHANDDERDRILAEEIKKRDLCGSFARFGEKEVWNGDKTTSHSELGHDALDVESEPGNEVTVKTEQEFEYVPSSTVDQVVEDRGEEEHMPSVRTERASAVVAKRLLEAQQESPPLVGRSGQRRKNTNSWEPSVKRRRTFPGVRHKDNNPDARVPPLRGNRFSSAFATIQRSWADTNHDDSLELHQDTDSTMGGMSTYEEAMLQLAQAEHKAKMLVLQSQRRAESAKEEAYKMILQNAQLQRDLLQMQYENVL